MRPQTFRLGLVLGTILAAGRLYALDAEIFKNKGEVIADGKERTFIFELVDEEGARLNLSVREMSRITLTISSTHKDDNLLMCLVTKENLKRGMAYFSDPENTANLPKKDEHGFHVFDKRKTEKGEIRMSAERIDPGDYLILVYNSNWVDNTKVTLVYKIEPMTGLDKAGEIGKDVASGAKKVATRSASKVNRAARTGTRSLEKILPRSVTSKKWYQKWLRPYLNYLVLGGGGILAAIAGLIFKKTAVKKVLGSGGSGNAPSEEKKE